MKKNYFLLLCSVLLSVSFLGTACSEDNTEPEVVAPSFPELVTKTATTGEVIDLSFDANYDWVASISESTYTYFQLLTGEGDNATTTKSVSGAPGKHTIKVKVAEDVVYENAPVGEVTLAMNGETKVIAKITYPVAERVISFYAPVVNNWGSFQGGAYGGTLLYTHTYISRLLSDRFVREDTNPYLTLTLHITGYSDTTSLNLTAGNPFGTH